MKNISEIKISKIKTPCKAESDTSGTDKCCVQRWMKKIVCKIVIAS